VLDAVAPGGTLLIVGHDFSNHQPSKDHEFHPSNFMMADQLATRTSTTPCCARSAAEPLSPNRRG